MGSIPGRTTSVKGVHEELRRQGIASELMRLKHEWLRERGFQVETSANQENIAMSATNLRQGFVACCNPREPHRVQTIFNKSLIQYLPHAWGDSTPRTNEVYFMTDTPKPGLLNAARRIAGAGADAASGRIAAAVGGARDLAGLATGKVGAAVGGATTAVANVLPDAKTVKQGFGRALILGGKALIDPSTVVGSFAMELGQRMAADDAAAPTWLALVANDAGFEVLARGEEATVRAAAAEAVAQQQAVLVCKVVEAHSAPQSGGLVPPG